MTASTAYARQPEMLIVSSTGFPFPEAEMTVEELEGFAHRDAVCGVKVGYRPAPLTPTNVRVGDGVTLCVGSDAYAGTVVWVSPSGKEFRWVHDTARQVGDYYQAQRWEYEPGVGTTWSEVSTHEEHSNACVARWSVRQGNGCFRSGGHPMIRGRHAHQDPSF